MLFHIVYYHGALLEHSRLKSNSILVLGLDLLHLNLNFSYWLYDLEQVTQPLIVFDVSSENRNNKSPDIAAVQTPYSNYDN